MAIPPKGDPRRPLHLAIRSMRLLGGVLLLLVTCGALTFLMRDFGTVSGRPADIPVITMILGLLFYVMPAAGFLILAHYLKRRKLWAVVASICLASLLALFALIGLLIALFIAIGRDASLAMLIPAGVVLLIVLALGQLIYHLARSFAAIRHAQPEQRGFEPIMVPPMPASAMYQQQQPQHGGQTHERPNPPAGGDVV